MPVELLKYFLIGICAAVPFGPVLVMVTQKTLSGSRRLGFCCGLGSTLVDTLYATVGLFALGAAETFLKEHETVVLTCGGVVLITIGILLFRKKIQGFEQDSVTASDASADSRSSLGTCFSGALQTALCALSNPGAILMIALLLAFFHLQSDMLSAPVWAFMLAVAAGEASYWFVLTGLLRKFGNFKVSTIQKISRIAGLLIVGFGIVLFIKDLIDLLR